MTTDEHAEPVTDTSADTPAGTTTGRRGWRGLATSPLRTALIAVAATLVLVAGPCAIGAFALGAVAGAEGWGHEGGDGGRDRSDSEHEGDRSNRDEQGDRGGQGGDQVTPPATTALAAVVPSATASN